MKHIFIVNPSAGRSDKTENIRRQLEELSADGDFDYLLFISEYEGHETELVKQLCELFSNETIRFYSCGGSGTLQRVLNGTVGFHNTETAMYPIGFTNDLIKSFSFDRSDFSSVSALVNGKTLNIDSIDCGDIRAANTAVFGITAKIICEKDIFRIMSCINPNVPYAVTSIGEFAFQKTPDFELVLDGEDYSGRYYAVIVFNGAFIGGNIAPVKTASPTDRLFNVVTISGKISIFKAMKILSALRSGNPSEVSGYVSVYTASDVKIRQKNAKVTVGNFDGEFYSRDSFHIENNPARIPLVIPENVTLKTRCGEKNKHRDRDALLFPLSGII